MGDCRIHAMGHRADDWFASWKIFGFPFQWRRLRQDHIDLQGLCQPKHDLRFKHTFQQAWLSNNAHIRHEKHQHTIGQRKHSEVCTQQAYHVDCMVSCIYPRIQYRDMQKRLYKNFHERYHTHVHQLILNYVAKCMNMVMARRDPTKVYIGFSVPVYLDVFLNSKSETLPSERLHASLDRFNPAKNASQPGH